MTNICTHTVTFDPTTGNKRPWELRRVWKGKTEFRGSYTTEAAANEACDKAVRIVNETIEHHGQTGVRE